MNKKKQKNFPNLLPLAWDHGEFVIFVGWVIPAQAAIGTLTQKESQTAKPPTSWAIVAFSPRPFLNVTLPPIRHKQFQMGPLMMVHEPAPLQAVRVLGNWKDHLLDIPTNLSIHNQHQLGPTVLQNTRPVQPAVS